MKKESRRVSILRILKEAGAPVSAASLAEAFSVSRQVIVGDIALLRAEGMNISATPRGYVLSRAALGGLVRTIACSHSGPRTGEELYIIVDNGCTAQDVIVEHPLYGQLTGSLQLSSRYDVDQFLRRLGEENAVPLLTLTGGPHLHTLRCPDEEAFLRVKAALQEKGILYQA